MRRSFTGGKEDTPKSGRERTVPLAEEVARALAGLTRREDFVGEDDLIFCGVLGGHLMPSRLRELYKRVIKEAGLRELRFHDLRHTFGTHAIRTADSREVMEWMGHGDLKTTQIYLSYKPQRDAESQCQHEMLHDAAFLRGSSIAPSTGAALRPAACNSA